MNKKMLVLPLAALAAGIALTACGTSAPAPVVTHTATSATASRTPAATPASSLGLPASAASPVGTWNVAYTSAPASILGQYSITQDIGTYYITTKTVLKVPAGNCSLPAGIDVGVFSGAGGNGPGGFSGTENLYEPGTCAPSTGSIAGQPANAALTVTISGNTMILLVPGQQSVTLTRVGSAPSSSPSAPAAAAPATGCLVPDLLDATSASAAALVHSAGFQSVVLTAKTFPGNSSTSPGNFPAGFVWGTNPPETTRAPCGSTVTVYYQPSAAASAPAASCVVPDVLGDGSGVNGHLAAEAAVHKVADSCPPVGYHVVTVLTVSGPAGTPQGTIWKESPPAGSSAPPGSTVKLYFQP
jgi:hypothetical protein